MQDLPVRPRRMLRRYDPEDEITFLREKVELERGKRRQLEQDLYKLKLERSDMSKLENSRVMSSVPVSMMPMLVDAMAKGIDPAKLKPENNVRLSTQPPVKAAPPKVAPPVKPATQPRATTAAPARATTTAPRNRGRPRAAPLAAKAAAPAQSPAATATAATAAPKPSSVALPDGTQYMIQTREADGKTITFLVPLGPGQVVEQGSNAVNVINMTSEPISGAQPVIDLTAEDGQATATAQSLDVAADKQSAIPDTPESPVETTAAPEESDFVDMES